MTDSTAAGRQFETPPGPGSTGSPPRSTRPRSAPPAVTRNAGSRSPATLHEARAATRRHADLLRPESPATADIVAFHRDETVDHYEGTTSDIFARVNARGTRPGRHRPTTHHRRRPAVAVDGER